ncbi:MAG: GH3 auxin-responsive promoter [Deltaproteobacteria bacterium]|jgi:hypothetical protein|nr:GH3 auxin-responsive promoter [Deltaproteobacteria bacterium]
MRRLLFYVLRWMAWPFARRFRGALENPRGAQANVLAAITAELRQTDYGKHLGVETTEDFRKKVPVVDYDDLAPWIEKQKKFESGALIATKVLFYEKTSGSTGPAKYIPYTKALRTSFTRMFLVWAYDVVARGPGIGSGKLYFSVSPSFDEEKSTESGVAVGMDDDAEYLGGIWRHLMSPFFLSPVGLGRVRDPEVFKRKLSEALLSCEDLESVSIWNPSFLTVILDFIEDNAVCLAESVGSKMSPERRAALENKPIDWQKIWPNLKFISAWSDANARPLAEKLQEKMPHALVQGKGLLATEAPMTIPMIGVQGGVPLVNEVFLEFQNEAGDLLAVDELELGESYSLVVSQRGGLVRYRMGDQVEAVSRVGNTPTIRFLGRNNRFSDLVGEKLNESFVRQVIDDLAIDEASFRTLMPIRTPNDHYVLLLDACEQATPKLSALLEEGLSQAYHYRHARALGQLGAARVVILKNAEEEMAQYHGRAGKRIGDMKQSYLVGTPADSELCHSMATVQDIPQ